MTDIGHLAAYVEMNELEAILQVVSLKVFESLEQFGRSETELRGIATRLLPFARARRSELDAYTDIRLNAQAFSDTIDDLKFVEFFGNNIYALAHLLGEQGKFDERIVLVAIADDERVVVGASSDDSVEFWF